MKLENATKSRIRLESFGGRWLLLIDGKPVITTTDHQWLRTFAVKLHETLGVDSVVNEP